MKVLARFALAALAVGCLGATPVRPFTMDDVLSAPFVTDLSASPDGTSLAYVADEKGRRNLYFSRSGGPAQRITSYGNDDGQVLGDVHIAPGNGAVVYVRGEGTNDRGEYPNPLTLPEPPKQQLYIVSTQGGTPVEIGEGHSVAVSPQGDRVVWLLHGQPYIATIESHGAIAAGKPARLFQIRGRLEDAAYSPDGSRVAFTNVRDDHGFVVIYDLRAQTLIYATAAFAYDSNPVWSPDGKRLAFIRTPGTLENEDPYADPPKEPWSLWVADAATGNAKRVFRADAGMGSEYYGTMSAQQLWWSGDGRRLAFDWEKHGWRHLYSVDANGGRPKLLMAGAFEVETVARSFDGMHLIYAANEGDIDRRHLWSVSFDGGAPVQLTRGTEDQWAPTPLANGVAYIDAGYAVPPAVYTLASLGTVVRQTHNDTYNDAATKPQELAGGPMVPGQYPQGAMVRPQLVMFDAPDGLTIHGQLFVPHDGARKHCGLIFDHGGSQRQMLPGFHYMETYTNLYESNQFYANHGCVVLSINYRSGIMYGHNFREPKNYGRKGASEYQDVLAGARYLQHRSDVDPKRIGIYGLSYGGYLTALGLARNSDVFKAGVDMAGVHNWATLIEPDPGQRNSTRREREIAYDASPIADVNHWRSPVFISQGDDDRNVLFSQGVDLATRLRARGVEVQELVFPNETHENITYTHMLELYDQSSAWLLRKLTSPNSQ